jgi:hypothetical protein
LLFSSVENFSCRKEQEDGRRERWKGERKKERQLIILKMSKNKMGADLRKETYIRLIC